MVLTKDANYKSANKICQLQNAYKRFYLQLLHTIKTKSEVMSDTSIQELEVLRGGDISPELVLMLSETSKMRDFEDYEVVNTSADLSMEEEVLETSMDLPKFTPG